MIDGPEAIGEAAGRVGAGAGEAAIALADLMRNAVWMGREAPDQHEAGQTRIDTERGPQDDRRAG
jgi:hypothetical protein